MGVSLVGQELNPDEHPSLREQKYNNNMSNQSDKMKAIERHKMMYKDKVMNCVKY